MTLERKKSKRRNRKRKRSNVVSEMKKRRQKRSRTEMKRDGGTEERYRGEGNLGEEGNEKKGE